MFKHGALLATAFIAVPPAFAEPQEARIGRITINVNCVTEATGGDGVRHSCNDRDQAEAPPGFVIDQQSINYTVNGQNGSSHRCWHEFSDFREIVPGLPITQPGRVDVYARASSPRGYWAGRGWKDCTFTMMQVDIPQLQGNEAQAFIEAVGASDPSVDASNAETPSFGTTIDPQDFVQDRISRVQFEAMNVDVEEGIGTEQQTDDSPQ